LKSRGLTHFLIVAVTLCGMIFLHACSTKKNTFTRRAFHNVNTHYNVYWNGNESFKQGVEELQKSARENYNRILPVFNFGTADEAKKVSNRMDRAIEKATIGIRRHSMVFKNKEYNKWIDDCFMLIGKSQFYKQDYNSARRTFEHIMSEYPGQPVYYDALLWIIQSNIQQKHYDEAIVRLEELDALISKETVPFRVRRMLPLVYADYYLKINNLNGAENALKQGIELNTSGRTRARLNFILAQIYQQQKDYARATEHYTKVLKGPSSFEMAFNARINMARSFDIYGGNKAGLEKELHKMLKDSKAVFKNWTLAAAAYNAGEGRIMKELNRQKVDNYYDLFLNAETSRYIYRILALKLLYEHPTEFGFYLRYKDQYPPIPTYKVAVDSTVNDLVAFAQQHQINYRILKDFNPWLLKDKLTVEAGRKYTFLIPKPGFINYDSLVSEISDGERIFNDTVNAVAPN